MSIFDFIGQLSSNPMLAVSTVLTLGVILVNGWTDAPNAIATCVSTRAIGVRKAIIMAAIFNFLGVLVMTSVNASVAFTIYNMVDFGGNSQLALVALCAAMAAIVIWATAAWYFGIPTSESHALIAGISGAAVAIQNSFSGINGKEWIKVIYGIFLSTLLGFVLGFISSKITVLSFRNKNRLKSERFFSGAQVAGGAAMAFMHGAQDGQKFMAIFLLGAAMANGQSGTTSFSVPIWLMLLCSAVMGLGTSIGGYRIIKSVGMDMVKLKPYQGPVGVFRLRPSSGGIKPLTCTIFDPTYFGTILKNQIAHISPTRLKFSIIGNYLDFALKIAHRGNTGSHRGKRKSFCMLG